MTTTTKTTKTAAKKNVAAVKAEEIEAAFQEGEAKVTPTNLKRYARVRELQQQKDIIDKEIAKHREEFEKEMLRKGVNKLTTKDGLVLASVTTTHPTSLSKDIWVDFPELKAIYVKVGDSTRFDWKKVVV